MAETGKAKGTAYMVLGISAAFALLFLSIKCNADNWNRPAIEAQERREALQLPELVKIGPNLWALPVDGGVIVREYRTGMVFLSGYTLDGHTLIAPKGE